MKNKSLIVLIALLSFVLVLIATALYAKNPGATTSNVEASSVEKKVAIPTARVHSQGPGVTSTFRKSAGGMNVVERERY